MKKASKHIVLILVFVPVLDFLGNFENENERRDEFSHTLIPACRPSEVDIYTHSLLFFVFWFPLCVPPTLCVAEFFLWFRVSSTKFPTKFPTKAGKISVPGVLRSLSAPPSILCAVKPSLAPLCAPLTSAVREALRVFSIELL